MFGAAAATLSPTAARKGDRPYRVILEAAERLMDEGHRGEAEKSWLRYTKAVASNRSGEWRQTVGGGIRGDGRGATRKYCYIYCRGQVDGEGILRQDYSSTI